MREAIGGSLLYYIIIPIIFLFIVFTAFIMNYASAYRASNYVISQIETCDADMNNCNHSNLDSIKEYVKNKFHYNSEINGMNFCYIQNNKGTIYRVNMGVFFDLPLFGRIGVYNVVSESKTIYNLFEGTNSVFDNGIVPCDS